MDWLDVFKHLLPRARAWRVTPEKQLRQFFEGLTGLPTDARQFSDDIYGDLDPQTTRQLADWEDQFGLADTGLSEQARRDRLEARWKAQGGQDPRYIQDTLQAAGFDVYVHEWWESIVGRPAGGSVDGDVTPVARNPFDFLWDGISNRGYIGCGHEEAYCGGDLMFSASRGTPPGYPLVNKVEAFGYDLLGVGHELMESGGDDAASGVLILDSSAVQYPIPADPTKYPFFLYIGGQTFPELVTLPTSRKNEFEELCLRICPTEQWLGILANYS